MPGYSRYQTGRSAIRRKSAAWRQKGVTLLELLIVMAIVGILASLAGPNLKQQVNQGRERQATEQLYGCLLDARSRARSGMTTVKLSVVPQGLLIENTLEGSTLFPVDPLLSHLAFDTSDGTLSFGSNGGLLVALPVNLTLQTHSGQPVRFIIYPAIGAIRRR